MPRETVYLGAALPDEPRVQPDDPAFEQKNMAQCGAYILAIRRHCGKPPEGVKLHARLGNYAFGQAREVAVEFDTDDEHACLYAQRCQEMGPRTWADAGMGPPRMADGRRL